MVLFLLSREKVPCLGLASGIELEQVLVPMKKHLQVSAAAPSRQEGGKGITQREEQTSYVPGL